jgi:hypothetical protein
MTVLELRQYTMVPGCRDDFVDIFDREFVETQEALGIEVLGQFRDLGDPDRYVWMRRFPDMPSRKMSLEAFYDGPVWAEHMDAANTTMTEWHDVLLLKPAWAGSDIVLAADRPENSDGTDIVIGVWMMEPADKAAFVEQFRLAFPALRAALVTEPSENTYPRLPIREGESVFVALFDTDADLDKIAVAPSQILRLAPTARSRLHGA